MATYIDIAWDLAEDFVYEKYYIKGDYIPTPDHVAKKPAFLLFYKFLGEAWTLTMGNGVVFWHFSSKAKAIKKLKEIASTAKEPIQIVVKTKRGLQVIAESPACDVLSTAQAGRCGVPTLAVEECEEGRRSLKMTKARKTSHNMFETHNSYASQDKLETQDVNASQKRSEPQNGYASQCEFEAQKKHASQNCGETHIISASHGTNENHMEGASQKSFETHAGHASHPMFENQPRHATLTDGGGGPRAFMPSTSSIRFLVEQYYDIQKLRIMAFNGLVAWCKAQDSQTGSEIHVTSASRPAPETHVKRASHDSAETQVSDARGRYADEARSLISAEPESLPREIADLIWYCNHLRDTERALARRLDLWSREHPLRENYLSTVKGIGPIFSSGLIAWLEPISRFDNISRLWKYCGLAPGQRRRKGERAGYNPRLKTFMWKIAASFEKQNAARCKYRRIYDEKKSYYASRPDLKEAVDKKVKGARQHIRLMAMRYTVKRFLADLWLVWRKMEGLPVTKPYAIDILGHSGFEPPNQGDEK